MVISKGQTRRGETVLVSAVFNITQNCKYTAVPLDAPSLCVTRPEVIRPSMFNKTSLFQSIDDETRMKEQLDSLKDSVCTAGQCLRTADNCSQILSEDPGATSCSSL